MDKRYPEMFSSHMQRCTSDIRISSSSRHMFIQS